MILEFAAIIFNSAVRILLKITIIRTRFTIMRAGVFQHGHSLQKHNRAVTGQHDSSPISLHILIPACLWNIVPVRIVLLHDKAVP